MNSVDALYAVTRLNWYSLHQEENSEVLFVFKLCRGFKFPLLNNQSVVFPTISGPKLDDSLLIYIFGEKIWPTWEEWIDEDWLHYIEATVFALKKRSICDCCVNVIKYFDNLSCQV